MDKAKKRDADAEDDKYKVNKLRKGNHTNYPQR